MQAIPDRVNLFRAQALRSVGGAVRVFGHGFAHWMSVVELQVGFRLKRCHACDQLHFSPVFTHLTGWHCKLRPNTKGNGWRMSHNPVSVGLLDVLDRVGVVAMEETRIMGADPTSVMNMGAMVCMSNAASLCPIQPLYV
jgi:hypothetical protein